MICVNSLPTPFDERTVDLTVFDYLLTFKLIFWDFDGVVKDSVDIKSQAYVNLFESYGNHVADQVKFHHESNGGMSRFEKLPLYLRWAGELVTEEKIRDYCDRFSRMVLQAVIDAPWVPGVREYLLAYHDRQHFVLVTATPQEEIQQILQVLGIAHCFLEVHGAQTPKATAIRDVLLRLQYRPEHALVVGDSETDLNTAEVNQVAFLLRRTPFNQYLQDRFQGLFFYNLNFPIYRGN